MMVRTGPRSRILLLSITATPSPSTIEPTTVTPVKISVTRMTVGFCGSWNQAT